ncbi:hypothetical protein [uncultured Thiodictyon sp.]|uniref:hypothetical protein n=1 Tax=uncultured Thiodictyon sp. TaxID=1846217 RepID=UPI0025EF1D9D|nr:hypothetical protein [uncultured Thiodictyon sp.]
MPRIRRIIVPFPWFLYLVIGALLLAPARSGADTPAALPLALQPLPTPVHSWEEAARRWRGGGLPPAQTDIHLGFQPQPRYFAAPPPGRPEPDRPASMAGQGPILKLTAANLDLVELVYLAADGTLAAPRQRTGDTLPLSERDLGTTMQAFRLDPRLITLMLVAVLIVGGRILREVPEQTRRMQQAEHERVRLAAVADKFSGLLQVVSHEVRNPASSLRLLAGNLRRGLLSNTEAADDLTHLSNHLVDIVQSLQAQRAAFATGRAADFHYDLHAKVEQVQGALGGHLDRARLDLVIAAAPDPGCHLIDAPRLVLILGNLLDNAFKYGGPGRVRLALIMVVEDDPIGGRQLARFLTLLHDEAPATVARDAIIRVLGRPENLYTRARLDTAISRLRHKIATVADQPAPFTSVYGTGYVWVQRPAAAQPPRVGPEPGKNSSELV